MSAVKESGIFYLQKLIKNIEVKKSAATNVLEQFQILCLVLKNDELFLRYASSTGEIILKTINYFETKRIQDVCFDDTGTWLLVLCYDNTLHVVPALYICDKSAKFKLLFSATEISSFVIPFSPPHECPNPQSCPNPDLVQSGDNVFEKFNTRTILPSNTNGKYANKVNEALAAHSMYNQFYCDPSTSATSQNELTENPNNNVDTNSLSINQPNSKGSTPIDSQILSSSIESTTICPYPKCVTWWHTNNGDQRAIVGYSEGTICIVRLTINCPFIGTCCVERGNIEGLVVCRDNNSETITLMINTSLKEQWKLMLEHTKMRYTFPGDHTSMQSTLDQDKSDETTKKDDDSLADHWQFIVNLDEKDNNCTKDHKSGSYQMEIEDSFEKINMEEAGSSVGDTRNDGVNLPKTISAAKARLMSLRDMGAKKIGTLKLKLAESRLKSKEREKSKEQPASLGLLEPPSAVPEILTTPSGPYFIVQRWQNEYLLSALHSYSDTLSVHRMDISLIPLLLYKVPRNCRSLMLTKNLMYTIQTMLETGSEKDVTPTNEQPMQQSDTQDVTKVHEEPNKDSDVAMKKSSLGSSSVDIENVISTSSQDETNTNSLNIYNGFGVVSCNMSTTKLGDDCEFNERALISLYKFEDEQVINLHNMISVTIEEQDDQTLQDSLNSVRTDTVISNYFNLKSDAKKPIFSTNFAPGDASVLQNKFPAINFEKCILVTDKNVYTVEIIEQPHIMFLKLVDQANWSACEEFCNVFDLSLTQCIEFAGDVLLKKKKVTQALLTYNIARVPPIKTALKLAMFGEVNALMHLCAMAIKNTFLLNSKYLMHPNMKYLIDSAHLRHLKYETLVKNKNKAALKSVNTGRLCSDFSYETDEISSDLQQMSSSSQFHLSNLLFLALTERCIRDKNYIPLWNFIATNTKFHTSLSSVVLSQSGLYSSSILLAMMRGACLDVFSCLVGAADQVLDVGQEFNFYIYNLSEEIFMECIIYLQDYAMEYFESIRKHVAKLDLKNLERLERQLNPFQAVYRPVMSKMLSSQNNSQERDKRFLEFCKYFIETYVIILIQTQALKLYSDNYLSALNSFRLLYKSVDEQRLIKLDNHSPISTGFSHSAYVYNGAVYIWGSNGVSCALSRNLITTENGENTSSMPTCLDFFKDLEVEVYSVHCGKSHTIFLTNNGLYSFGANSLGQLGIGKTLCQALQPMLIREFDEGQSISQVCAGQYHNAVVVDGTLYTWGWGVYGQLGHGNTENEYMPKPVKFFKGKKILQIALGHAHTIILCRESKSSNSKNIIFAFGSNHYGSLGIGHGEDTYSKSHLKSAIPVELKFDEEVKLIHTKFFCNLVVTTSNRLYSWGASPQAIRLSTQAKKRARANQRSEEAAVRNGRVTTVNESDADVKMQPMPNIEDDPDCDDDVFIEKANEECQEKDTQEKIEKNLEDAIASSSTEIPEIKIDLVEERVSEDDPKEPILDECTDHLKPSLVVIDDELKSSIIKLGSGLYHYAFVTEDGQLFTWGKNLERQLGREGSRNEVIKPTKLEGQSNIIDVTCGSDFSIILLNDGTVKAFGNNNNGQCGLEIQQTDKSGIAGKLVRLRISKRLVRIPDGSQCIEMPTVIKFPCTDPYNLTNKVVTLKGLPKYQANCVIKSSLVKLPIFNQISGHTTIDSNLNEFCKDEMGVPDLIRNIDAVQIDANQNENQIKSISNAPEIVSDRMCMMNSIISGQSTVSTPANINKFSMDSVLSNDFIHYCLYIFHGLYDQSSIIDFSSNQLPFKEYKLRVLMLNFSFIDAFKLCLTDCLDVQKCIKLFEYFTKDPAIMPLHEEQLKYFIYEIFKHFIRNQMNISLLEDFILSDLNHYLIQLSYVLYFNNNNTALEKSVFQKFKSLFTNFDTVNLENTDVIFKMISTKFNVLVCQKLIEMAETVQI